MEARQIRIDSSAAFSSDLLPRIIIAGTGLTTTARRSVAGTVRLLGCAEWRLGRL